MCVRPSLGGAGASKTAAGTGTMKAGTARSGARGRKAAPTLEQAWSRAWRYILDIDETLIANVGVTAWLTLMVFYSFRFPVFAVAGASTATFGLLYQYLSVHVPTWGVKGCNEHFINALTTTVHSFVVSVVTYASIFVEYDDVYSDLRQNSSVMSKAAVGIAVGYFAYDLWHIVNADMVRQSPALMVHHLAIMVIYSIVIVESQFYPYMVLTLLCEPHSMFMQLRKIAKVVFDLPRGIVENQLQSRIYWGLWVLNLVTCVVCRMLPHGAIIYNVYFAREDKAMFPQSWMFTCALGGMALVNVINMGLFVSIFKAYKKDVRIVNSFRLKRNEETLAAR